MARTLYLENGKIEYVFAGETEEEVLQRIIYENLGRDCEELFTDVIEETRHPYEFENYEEAADGYRSMCVEAMENFEQAIKFIEDAKKLDKRQLLTHLKLSRKLLYDNL